MGGPGEMRISPPDPINAKRIIRDGGSVAFHTGSLIR
jgi:hypothetical protein